MNVKKIIPRLFLTVTMLAGTILFLHAQKLVDIVLVGKDGITDDVKKATSFIAIKAYPGGVFERIDYKLQGPIIQLRTYSDSTLTSLSGRSFEYTLQGRLYKKGYYSNNHKTGNWDYLNDTGKVIKTERYQDGVLVNADVKDTADKKDTTSYPDEREAVYQHNEKDWIKYIQENLDPNAAVHSVKGGQVLARFVVNTNGATDDIYMEKSVEFVLDEAAIKVIQDSPPWTPAFQNGKTMKAYRRQPLTFVVKEE